jgi:integrase
MKKSIIFVDFYPAELKENSVWEIVYYVKNPETDKMIRKRNRVKPLQKISDRRKLAKKMIIEINKRLENGWNPLFQDKGTKELMRFKNACNIYINRINQETKDGNLRADTQRTYNSQIKQLYKYLEVTKQSDMLCYKFNGDFVSEYLDYVRYERGLSAKTRDNYLSWLTTFSTFLLQKKYIVIHPTANHHKINKQKKIRVLINPTTRDVVFDFWKEKNNGFLVLCLLCYYCLIRRTEITKLKVSDINFLKQTIYISSENSKNRKNSFVTIPDQLIDILEEHVKGAVFTDYLFTKNYTPGEKPVEPNSITKKWAWMRKKLNLDDNIHWYSLKDSGITDLLKAGVPLLSVRNHARHHSSAQTDTYTPKDMREADPQILHSSVVFSR